MTDAALLAAAGRAVGPDLVRTPHPGDVVDGAAPRVVIAPTSVEHVAEALRWAHASRLRVVIRGAGTKAQWGRVPASVDVLLSLAGLDRVIAHEAMDLTATIEAGAPLARVNARLREHRQWLPLDPPSADRATIGGVLATNDSGPSRHRHGTPRDLVIGMTFVAPDGTVATSGGRVVKNVAGYDLARLLAGSHGSLAAIVSATFKLAPVERASRTLVAHLPAPAGVAGVVDSLRKCQCEPEALDVRLSASPGTRATTTLVVRYASVPAAVDHGVAMTRDALERAGALDIAVVDDGAETDVWRHHDAEVRTRPVVLQMSWMPASFADASAALLDAAHGLDLWLVGRAAIGVGRLGLDGSPADITRAIGVLRTSSSFAHVVIVNAATGIRTMVDAWPPPGPQQRLMDALKHACDPGNVLNAERGPL